MKLFQVHGQILEPFWHQFFAQHPERSLTLDEFCDITVKHFDIDESAVTDPERKAFKKRLARMLKRFKAAGILKQEYTKTIRNTNQLIFTPQILDVR